MDSCKGKVSIIIGLFNVSKYLEEKRLSCILQQTWSDLEILLINDGSTDNTPHICQELAKEDARIRLINKPNGGLGSARNAGLDAATGEFVWFYDVDDDVELDLVEKNVRWMRAFAVDMTVFGMFFTYPDTCYTETSHFKDRLFTSNEELKARFVKDLFLIPNGNGFVANKFYRRDFIERDHTRFGWQRIQQDELFNLFCEFFHFAFLRLLFRGAPLISFIIAHLPGICIPFRACRPVYCTLPFLSRMDASAASYWSGYAPTTMVPMIFPSLSTKIVVGYPTMGSMLLILAGATTIS